CDEVNDKSNEKIDSDFLFSLYSSAPDKSYYFMKQIIGSEVGADRLDYLHRDSIECNVPYGLVDPRIFNEFSVEGNELVLDKDALPLVDTIFHSLFQMKYAVYDHKASRAVLRMLKEPYKEALRRRRAKRLHLLIESDDFEFLG